MKCLVLAVLAASLALFGAEPDGGIFPKLSPEATVSQTVGTTTVVVDYHRPVFWHPMRPLMRMVFGRLEPFAMDLWTKQIEDFLPAEVRPAAVEKRTYFGGLYQKLVWVR